MEAATEVKKTVIRPDTSKMVKAKGGSFHKDDFIGNKLAGLTVAQVLTIGAEMGVEVSKYSHLNPGQQRMTLGNQLRARCADVSEDGLEGEALDKAIAANVASEKIRDTIEGLAAGMKESNANDAAAKAAEKEAAKAEKAAAAAEKKAAKKAKVADSAEGEGDTPD